MDVLLAQLLEDVERNIAHRRTSPRIVSGSLPRVADMIQAFSATARSRPDI
jgi:hypothetical protein